MRERLDNEGSSQKASTAAPNANGKSEAATKKSAAAIAAEVADKLAASSSSQMIMTSVLSSFAAEEAKSARLTSDSRSTHEKSMPTPDPHFYMSAQQLAAAPNHSYPSVLVTQPIMQNPAPASQGQYHMLCNPSSQQYMQSTGGGISPYGYGSISSLPPQPHVVGAMAPPLTHQTQQIIQHQPLSIPQQAPAAPSFRPLQPPGMVYYATHQHPI